MINNGYGSSFVKVAIGSVTAVAMVIVIIILVTTLSVSGAITRLTSEGYIVLAAGEYDSLNDNVNALLFEIAHNSSLFPEDTDETVTFTAGVGNNDFGVWTEIADNNGVKLSSKGLIYGMHLSVMQIESTTVADVMYIFEIAYGDSKTSVARSRFGSGTKFVGVQQQTSVRAEHIPSGELIYYRMKCETADAEATVSFRYHLHDI